MRFISVIIGTLFVSSAVLTGCKDSSDEKKRADTEIEADKMEEVDMEKEADRITKAAVRGKKPTKDEVRIVHKYAMKNGFVVDADELEAGLNLLAEYENETDQTKKIEIAKRIQALQQKMQLSRK